jgi:hypothetical protein
MMSDSMASSSDELIVDRWLAQPIQGANRAAQTLLAQVTYGRCYDRRRQAMQ